MVRWVDVLKMNDLIKLSDWHGDWDWLLAVDPRKWTRRLFPFFLPRISQPSQLSTASLADLSTVACA
jgi:hypothetical protein